MKRNYDKYTSSSKAKKNILDAMKGTDDTKGLLKSEMGYAAFPDYNFNCSQGSAFSVARICREMEDDKLIRWSYKSGYYITKVGKELLST